MSAADAGRRWRWWIAIAALLAFSFFLRVWGARQGLPYRPELLSFDGQSEPDAAIWEAGVVRGHLIGRASTIYGGSSEIQKNVVAKALGL